MKSELETLDPEDRSPRANQIRNSLLPHSEWLSANGKRQKIKQKWEAYFNDFDVILCPTALCPAFDHDHQPDFHSRLLQVNGEDRNYTDIYIWAGLASCAQLPATNIPIGISNVGLPISIQVMGSYLEDKTTIEFAKLVSEITGGFVAPPD